MPNTSRLFHCFISLATAIGLAGCGTKVESPSTKISESTASTAYEPLPVLHVVGVYEGLRPATDTQQPREAVGTRVDQGHRPVVRAMVAPPRILAGSPSDQVSEREERIVRITVSDESSPIVLGLMAYERTRWIVETTSNVKLKRVILAGYHTQAFEGIPASVPIEVFTYEATECGHCVQRGRYFYSYTGVPPEMEAAAGLKAKSFQGKYSGGSFAIFPGM